MFRFSLRIEISWGESGKRSLSQLCWELKETRRGLSPYPSSLRSEGGPRGGARADDDDDVPSSSSSAKGGKIGSCWSSDVPFPSTSDHRVTSPYPSKCPSIRFYRIVLLPLSQHLPIPACSDSSVAGNRNKLGIGTWEQAGGSWWCSIISQECSDLWSESKAGKGTAWEEERKVK